MNFKSSARLAILIGSTSTVALTAANPASAQMIEPTSTVSDVPQNDEIVVTARKESEVLSKVGLSITAATGEQLAERGIATVEGLVKLEPSLQYAKSFDNTSIYTIRGVGYNDNSIQAAPTVSVYLDEVPYAYPVMTKGPIYLCDPLTRVR